MTKRYMAWSKTDTNHQQQMPPSVGGIKKRHSSNIRF